ncbi:phage integrase SAM-like domain-containing protein [Spirosoma foliorum]|uniref:Phage integrase SAM-like domain-containing protein n=1 Tax=Spirosoma foliorum TaxID=2710596 RepID=A0A7G5GZ03_9BACT|nr:phage integrase SAM-like domain-containing protein [Spirosoma foliorum]QMW04095.1 phage integrase SAM-like domain-containing protein [Spirosoma foliorum]
MRILFKIRLNKRNPSAKAVIYCRVRIDGITANDFSTFIQVMPESWDAEKQLIKGGSLRARDDNNTLKQIHSDLTKLHLHFQINEEFISAQHLVDIFTKKHQITYTFSQLVDLFEKHVLATYSNEGTRRNYNTRIENIRLFLEEQKWTNLQAERFTLGCADEFVRWARVRGLDNNYIVRHTQVLKNITESAVRSEILKIDKLAAFVLKKKEKVNTDHLTRAQLIHLDRFDWRPELRRIVDLFLFSVYSGLHYEDAQTLTSDEIRTGIDGRKWLFKPRGKYAESEFFAGESVQIVPLSDEALALIEKYGSVELLPKISNSGYNDWLKQIQHMAGIKLNLTVKIARKTFTNVMLNELGVSEESVAAMLGHSSTKHVRYYGKANEERVAREVVYK